MAPGRQKFGHIGPYSVHRGPQWHPGMSAGSAKGLSAPQPGPLKNIRNEYIWQHGATYRAPLAPGRQTFGHIGPHSVHRGLQQHPSMWIAKTFFFGGRSNVCSRFFVSRSKVGPRKPDLEKVKDRPTKSQGLTDVASRGLSD